MTSPESGALPISPWWRRSVLLVAAFGFSILLAVTALTYTNAPPIPDTVTNNNEGAIFGKADILRGQEVFLKYALMEHGTLWGHGAYLGPDYSAQYLHRLVEISRDALARTRFSKSYAELERGSTFEIAEEVRRSLKENRYAPATRTLIFSPEEAEAFQRQKEEWRRYFSGTQAPPGLRAGVITDPRELDALTAYFAWAAWACVANRPGKDYSYTNNFPYDPDAGNRPAASAYLWSAMSLVSLLAGLGLVFFFFGKFDFLGWKGFPGPGHPHENRFYHWAATPSQRVTALFFAVVAVLFLLQTLAGGLLSHYRVEPNGFYGIDLVRFLPYNLMRTWHLQLAIFWIATAWVGGGLFLAPLVGGEPKGQRLGVLILLGAFSVVIGGSLLGEWLGMTGRLGSLWFWFGHQGSEYLDLGRFWQALLVLGLSFWIFLMYRALRPAMRRPGHDDLASLFLFAAGAIVIFYLPAFMYGPHDNFAVIDNWRFWIIHLWVEGFFELFSTVLVAVMFLEMGLVSARTATRLVYLDAILFLGGGIVGTGHHWYFTGQGTLNMGLASCFSALEVVPLTLLTLEAWDFVRLRDRRCEDCGTPFAAHQIWAIYFLTAVGFWNFVGAGIFGFLINLPIVSYFEVGTQLTNNHAHASMFGVFGMLALAVLVFCLRALQDEKQWKRAEPWVKVGFWGLNVGLGLMVVLNLFPTGVLQFWDCLKHGYWHARSLDFLMSGTFHKLEWLRIGADVVFLLFGVFPIVFAALLSVYQILSRPQSTREVEG